jgi:calpain-15
VLLGAKIEPSHVIQGSLGDCYFLSALAALAEREERVRTLFEGQSYNPAGIYKVVMRINGELEEVVVDDFVPVNEHGQPLFCQPCRNEFWVLIL